MADIRTFLDKIKSAIYGRDVRQAIHDGIRCCYEDGRAGATDLTAREDIATIQADISKGLVKENYFCEELADVHMAIRAELAKMEVDSIRHVSVKLNMDYLQGSARLTVYLGLNQSGEFVANAELATTDGHRLYTYGHVAAGALLDEMVFSDWEWDNPPLLNNVEYCTTERHLGVPVYVRRVEFSDFKTLGSTVTRSFDESAMPQIVSVAGIYNRVYYGADDMISSYWSAPCPAFDTTTVGEQARLMVVVDADSYRNTSTGKYSLGVNVTPFHDYLLSEDSLVSVIVKYTK